MNFLAVRDLPAESRPNRRVLIAAKVSVVERRPAKIELHAGGRVVTVFFVQPGFETLFELPPGLGIEGVDLVDVTSYQNGPQQMPTVRLFFREENGAIVEEVFGGQWVDGVARIGPG